MRIALISDMHGHAIALSAVLADIQQQRVDQVICLGDVTTVGVQPQMTLALLRSLNCPCLMGNHDAALLQPDLAAHYMIAPELWPTLHWCARQLTPEDVAFLRSFKPLLKIPLGGQETMVCFHGSPHVNTDLILATTPTDELERLLQGYTATIMAGGHSHMQMVRQHKGTLILNPGSVGNSFRVAYTPGCPPSLNPWAEYAIVTWQAGVLSVDCRRIAFDLAAAKAAIMASDIPNKAWWLAQYP